MDHAYNQLLDKGSIITALLVVIATFFIRRIVETAVPSAKGVDTPKGTVYKTRFGLWWNSVVLYAIPVVLGSGIAVLGKWVPYLLPAGVTTLGGAVLWGAIVGWFSSFLYKVFRKLLKDKTGIDPLPGPIDPEKPSDDEDKPEVDPKAEEPVKAAPEAKDEAPAVVKDKPAE
jgi:hypothetical protein